MQTRNLTDEEVLELGHQALVDKLGPANFVRFVRLYEPPTGDYTASDKPINHMTVQDIYDESVRLEAERKEGREAGS